tara:strand:+ start:14476 stop:16698 length:2223 start_codon:yes stop_codon:yes gene_type:complete
MIIERSKGRSILVRTRDENGKRVEKTYTGEPYCFVKDEDAKFIPCVRSEAGYEGVYGESLTKVVFAHPNDLHELKKTHSHIPTWEANIPYENRVLVDEVGLLPNYDHRIWYFDMEWKMDSGEITIITLIDSFTGKEYVFVNHPTLPPKLTEVPCKDHPEGLDWVKFEPHAKVFRSEKDMLSAFAKLMVKHDPDVLTGWNVVNADCKQLITRMTKCGLNPRTLSPMRNIRYSFTDWSQPIAGRLVIDLMVVFTRLWELKNGKLPNKTLDGVSEECLKEKKVPLKDGHDTFYTDIGTYLDYARQDTRLLVKLNALNNAIEHHLAVQHIVGCSIRATPFITKIFTVLALRDEEFKLRIPTKPQFPKEDYEGADIMPVEPQVLDHVGILDIRAMYHANADKYGISWENLDPENGVDCGNGVKFRREKGLLVRQMDYMTDLRNDYKTKLREAETEEERNKWEAMQYATKSIVASMYGAAGDAKYGLYHPQVAASITHTSRETLRELRRLCDERGHTVCYGHTDSVFAKMKTPEEGLALVSELNEIMSPIIVEFERWNKRLILMAKNRYVGSVEWTDGVSHSPKVYIKGIEMKQSRMPRIMKESMALVIESILTDKSESETTNALCEIIEGVESRNPLDLCMKGKLSKDLSHYHTLGEARAGAKWANDNLGKGYRNGSYFLTTLDEHGNYIAFDEPSEIEGIAKIGFRHLIERFIVRKIKDYYAVAGWDFVSIENVMDGKGSIEWL